jgi:hypothetical protein
LVGYNDKLKYLIESKLNNAPKITGSECDVEVFVNVLSGYNVYTSKDCNRCKYKDNKINNRDFICNSEESYECQSGEYQTRVLISIIGDLRDRNKNRTKIEYNKFKDYIKNTLNFYIRNESLSII